MYSTCIGGGPSYRVNSCFGALAQEKSAAIECLCCRENMPTGRLMGNQIHKKLSSNLGCKRLSLDCGCRTKQGGKKKIKPPLQTAESFYFILFTCLFGFTALGTDSRAFCTIGKSSTTDSTVPSVTGDTQLYLQLKC